MKEVSRFLKAGLTWADQLIGHNMRNTARCQEKINSPAKLAEFGVRRAAARES